VKTEGQITGARLKAETVKDDEGCITGSLTYWIVTVRVPAHKIDANELEQMTGEMIRVIMEPLQTKLKLEGATA